MKDYEPAVVVHAADCDEAPTGLMVYPAPAAANAFPTGRPHRCFNRSTDRAVVEHIDYEPHSYEQSTLQPDDAVRPLCRVCRGTHGEQQPQVRSGPTYPAPWGLLINRRPG